MTKGTFLNLLEKYDKYRMQYNYVATNNYIKSLADEDEIDEFCIPIAMKIIYRTYKDMEE